MTYKEATKLAEEIADVLRIDNETAIKYIANKLDIAYLTGQMDYIKKMRARNEQSK